MLFKGLFFSFSNLIWRLGEQSISQEKLLLEKFNYLLLCLCSLQFSTQKLFIIFKRQWKEYFISYKTHYFRLHEIWTEKIKVVTVCEICNALEAFVGRKSPGEEYFSAPLFCHLPSTCFLFLHLLLSPTKLLSGRPLFKKYK